MLREEGIRAGDGFQIRMGEEIMAFGIVFADEQCSTDIVCEEDERGRKEDERGRDRGLTFDHFGQTPIAERSRF